MLIVKHAVGGGLSKGNVQQDNKCLQIGNVPQLITDEEEQLTAGSVVLGDSVFVCQHQVTQKHDRAVRVQGFKAPAFELCAELQIVLGNLEKHLNVPSFGIDSDDSFFIKLHIRCQQRNPVVIFLVGAQKYDLYRYFLFILVVNLHGCGRNNIATTVVRKMIVTPLLFGFSSLLL